MYIHICLWQGPQEDQMALRDEGRVAPRDLHNLFPEQDDAAKFEIAQTASVADWVFAASLLQYMRVLAELGQLRVEPNETRDEAALARFGRVAVDLDNVAARAVRLERRLKVLREALQRDELRTQFAHSVGAQPHEIVDRVFLTIRQPWIYEESVAGSFDSMYWDVPGGYRLTFALRRAFGPGRYIDAGVVVSVGDDDSAKAAAKAAATNPTREPSHGTPTTGLLRALHQLARNLNCERHMRVTTTGVLVSLEAWPHFVRVLCTRIDNPSLDVGAAFQHRELRRSVQLSHSDESWVFGLMSAFSAEGVLSGPVTVPCGMPEQIYVPMVLMSGGRVTYVEEDYVEHDMPRGYPHSYRHWLETSDPRTQMHLCWPAYRFLPEEVIG